MNILGFSVNTSSNVIYLGTSSLEAISTTIPVDVPLMEKEHFQDSAYKIEINKSNIFSATYSVSYKEDYLELLSKHFQCLLESTPIDTVVYEQPWSCRESILYKCIGMLLEVIEWAGIHVVYSFTMEQVVKTLKEKPNLSSLSLETLENDAALKSLACIETFLKRYD